MADLCRGSGRFDDNDSFDHWSRADDDRLRGLGAHDPPPAPAPVDRNLSGEEAYMRRLGMSQGAPVASTPSPPSGPMERNLSGEEAYLRRLVMSSRGKAAHPASADIPSQSVFTIPSSTSTPMDEDEDEDVIPGLGMASEMDADKDAATLPAPEETGEEAYQRRLAISQGLRPAAPAFQPSFQLSVPTQPLSFPLPPPSPSRLAYDPFAPPVNVPPPPPPSQQPQAQIPSGFADKMKAAASIAAKLSALAPPTSASGNENVSASWSSSSTPDFGVETATSTTAADHRAETKR